MEIENEIIEKEISDPILTVSSDSYKIKFSYYSYYTSILWLNQWSRLALVTASISQISHDDVCK